MRPGRWAILPLLLACIAHRPAVAAGAVTIIRGNAAPDGTVTARPGEPTVFRGIAPGTSWSPEQAPAEPAPAPAVIRAGESLWVVGRDGTLRACSLRGSGTVDTVSREVIVCTESVID